MQNTLDVTDHSTMLWNFKGGMKRKETKQDEQTGDPAVRKKELTQP